MPAQAVIECEELVKTYRMGNQAVHALAGVSLTINDGDFVAIMGPSGSGKSTLMNMIGALDAPTTGVLKIAGEDISQLDHNALANLRNRVLGFVFQQFNLLPRTTALDNVKLPLLYSRRQDDDLNAIAEESLIMVGLEDRMNHQPSQLSGGQQQRVAIARALVNSPRIILADEPTGALDTRTSQEIMELFTELNSHGTTVILITHEEEVAQWASRSIRLRDGKIETDMKVAAE